MLDGGVGVSSSSVRPSPAGGLEVANPIFYREILARELASSPRAAMPQVAPTW